MNHLLRSNRYSKSKVLSPSKLALQAMRYSKPVRDGGGAPLHPIFPTVNAADLVAQGREYLKKRDASCAPRPCLPGQFFPAAIPRLVRRQQKSRYVHLRFHC